MAAIVVAVAAIVVAVAAIVVAVAAIVVAAAAIVVAMAAIVVAMAAIVVAAMQKTMVKPYKTRHYPEHPYVTTQYGKQPVCTVNRRRGMGAGLRACPANKKAPKVWGCVVDVGVGGVSRDCGGRAAAGLGDTAAAELS
jgi:hypothetical protein